MVCIPTEFAFLLLGMFMGSLIGFGAATWGWK